MIRRSLLLAVACVLGASCSSDDSSSDSDATTAAPVTAASTAAPSTEQSVPTESSAESTADTEASVPATEAPSETEVEAETTAVDTTDVATTDSAPPPSTAAATTEPAPTTEPFVSAMYSDAANWICRPDKDDLCDEDLDVTVVAADGTTTIEPFVPVTDAAADCFYLYPTTSEDAAMNSDLIAGAELATTRLQAAPFSQVCDVYAPLYRSVTLPALFGQVEGDRAAAGQIAIADVLEAWNHYLANDNDGRGVILIGHSQGSGQLARLLREQIDPNPAVRDLLISAYITGSSVAVPLDADVGGDLTEIPLCRAQDETGCVVTYATFRSTAPPPESSFFGRPRGDAGGMAGCVNPAAPAGGAAEVRSAFPSGDWALSDHSLTPTTPFMSFPGLVTAECKYDNGFSYLELTVHADPADPRTDDLFGADITPEWGTHLIDVNVVSGSLVAMARAQIEAYAAAS